MIAWDEKFRMKCLEESKGILCDDFKTEFSNAISSVIASLDADREEADSLAIFGAMIAGKIFDKQETNGGKNEKADD